MKYEGLKIGVDIDNCISREQEHFCELADRLFGYKLRVEDCIHPSGKFVYMGLISMAETRKILESEDLRNLKVHDHAVETLNSLAKNSSIYLVTSRDNYKLALMQKHTAEWLSKIGLKGYKEVIFSNEKGKVALKLGLDVFIEDSIEHAKKLIDAGIQVILFARPWNMAAEHTIPLVEDWRQIPPCLRRSIISK